MNHIYRSIWNQATGAYSAVSENVKGCGKRALPGGGGAVAQFALKALAASMMLGFGSLALAGPTGGVVVAGQANIGGAPGAMVIHQGSQNAVINWNNFNVAHGESVTFQQPNSASVVLNRVLGGDATAIMGNLSANGKVFLVNPNGVLFGKGASVNVGGLVASTLDISNTDFMAGNYKFSGNGTGKVLNQGAINAPGGYVALLGANVSNEGTIQARLGSVALAAGNAITLDVAGDGLLNVSIDKGALNALVNNGGLIQADGGTVVLTAQAAGDLLKTVVNNTGIIEAHSIDTRSGTIKLLGDMQSGTVNAGGTLDASAPSTGNGGFVETSAAHVKLDDALKVTTNAPHGLTGTWLIDPTDYTIAATGGDQTGAFFTNALKSSAVQIQSVSGGSGTAGDINVNDPISWSANQLKLTAQNNININKPLRGSGTASLALEYGQQAVAAGNTSVYTVKAEVDLPSGKNFSTRLGSDGTAVDYTVINSLGAAGSATGTDLQGLKNALSGYFVLGANIDASGTSNTAVWGVNGFTPIGTTATPFSGQFDGLGHVITGLNSSTTSSAGVAGLFGSTTGTLRNIGLVAPVIGANIAGTAGNIAALAASNSGTISNAYVSGGSVTIANGALGAGLVGLNSGTISDSYNSSKVSVTGNYDFWLGGLVGNTTKTSTVINSYNAGEVVGAYSAGGLVGNNLGAITNSFNNGNVTGTTNTGGITSNNRNTGVITNSFNTGAVTGNSLTGGLVGANLTSGQIINSYSTGAVSSRGLTASGIGGLAGGNSGIIRNSYATGAVTGVTAVGGLIGSNTSAGLTENAYSSGAVSLRAGGSGNVGGLIGSIAASTSPSITGGYYNTTVNPGLPGVGTNGGTTTPAITGLTASQMQVAANFGAFAFTTTTGATGNNWVIVDTDGTLNNAGGVAGGTGPMLASEYSSKIYSPHQLQLMAMNLAGNYTLAMDVNAATTSGGDVWGTGGFIPVGTSALPFTGSLNGAGRIISSLNIAKSGVTNVGLFGMIGSAGTVSNVGLSGGAVTGSVNVGALAGTNQGTISGSFATSTVIGDSSGGGLVGNNSGAIKDSYASGSVGGNNTMGGLVGTNTGTIATSYANGAVSTGSFGGGLVGTGKGSVTGSYWDTTTSAQSVSAGGTGLTSAQLKTLANYNSATAANGSLNPAWELSNMWVVYDGQSAPLLRSFMKPLVITVSKDTKVYDGLAASAGTNSVTYSNVVDNSLLFGTIVYAGSSGGAVNAGTYAVSASGQYSTTQLGYAVTYIDGGLVITPRQLSLTGVSAGSKVYDGTTSAALTGGSLSGVLVADQANVTFNAAAMIGAYASKNVGNNLAVSASGGLSGSASANYALGPLTGVTGNIAPKALTISGLAAVARQYDGTTAATLTGGTLSGMVSGEVVTAGASTGVFVDKNAGAGKALTVTAGSLIDGTGLASNYTLTAPTGITGTITAKALNLTGLSATSRIYDGTTAVALSGGTLDSSGFVGTETVGLGSLSGVFADKNVGTAKAVSVSGAALTDGSNGGLASNYSVATPSGLSANVTKATISSVSNIVTDSKVYDGNTKATVSAASATFNGMASGDSLAFSATSALFLDKNVGTKTTTVSGIALGGTDAANYNLTSTAGTGTGSITPKAVTIVGMTAINKIYDGSTKANVTGGSISGTVGAETLGATGLVATFSDKNAGTGKTVTSTGTALVNGTNGGLASNYTVTNPTFTANITQKALTVSGMTAASRVYDGTTLATLTGGALSGLVSGETLVFTGGSGVFVDKNAGSNKTITVSGSTIADGTGLASNYTVTNPTTVTGSITQKALTLSGTLVASDKVYDGTTNASISGGALSGFVGTETVGLAGLSGIFADKNAGNAKVVAVNGGTLANGTNGGLASNYSVSASGSLVANITQKALTVTGATAANRVYDGTLAATISGGTLDSSGFVGTETVGLGSLSGAFLDKNVGTAKAVSVSGAALTDGTNGGLASNYSVASPSGLSANVTKATISSLTNIVADSKVYDANTKATVSAASATYNGMASGDSLSFSATSALFIDKNVGTKTVTVSGIALGGTDAANYNLASTAGSGTGVITPKAVTIINMTAVNKVYDGTTKASVTGGSISGTVGAETLGATGLVATFSDKNAGTGKTVTSTGTALVNGTGGGLASNYSITNPTFTANITQKTLTVSGMTAGSKVYDGTTAATLAGGALSGLVTGETLVLTGGSGVFGDKNVGAAKAVTVSGVGVADGTGLASNYTVTNPTGVTGIITQKAVTIVGMTAVNKVYDGTTKASVTGGSISGTVGSETLGATGLVATFDDKNAGTGKTVTSTGTALVNGTGGGLASNYSISNPTFTANITPKAVTIVGMTAVNKAYDGTTKASVTGGAISGTIGAETLGATGLVATFNDANAGTGKTVTSTGTALVNGTGGGLASNYTVTNPTFTANITQKALTVTGMTADSKIYDGLLAASLSGGALSGLVTGETLVLSGGSGVFVDKNVGVAKAVTVSGVGIADGTGLASNYSVTNPTGVVGSIMQKAVTIVGMTAVNKTYDGTTKASVTGGAISGTVGSETLGATGLVATFDDKNAGTGKTVTSTGTALVNGTGGGLASNYSVSNPTFTANITPKALTVTGMTADSKVYDGLLAASLSGGTLSGLVTGETLVLSGATGVFGDKNVGTAKAVTVSGVGIANGTGLASNYSVSNPTSVTGSITQKALTVSGATAANKDYDGSTKATLSGGTLDGLVAGETLNLAGAFADQNAASNKAVTVSVGDGSGLAGNYALVNPTGLTASIAPKAVSVSGATVGNKDYDGSTKATLSGGTLDGLVGGETLTLAGAFADKNAAVNKFVTVSVGDGTGLAGNYALSNPTGLTAAIAPKAVTVSGATAGNKEYDGNTKATLSGGTIDGLIVGETLTLAAAFADKNAASSKAVNVSVGDGSGLAGNYALSNPTGLTATITTKAVSVSGITAGNKVYDGKTTASVNTVGATFDGMVMDDKLTASASGAFVDKNAATGKDVNITGIALGGLDAGNYSLSGTTAVAKADIARATINGVTGITAGTKEYDGKRDATLDTSGAGFTGMVAGDSLTASAAGGAFSDKNAGNNKVVNISGITLGGVDAGNYVLGNSDGAASGAITAKALTVTGVTAGDKTYDGTRTASLSGGALSGLVGQETLTLSGQTGLFSDKNAGAKAVTVSGATLGDAGSGVTAGLAGNYTVSNATGVAATITPKALTVDGVTAGDKTYDGTRTASLSGGTLSGLVGAETLGLSSLSGLFDNQNAGNNKAVTMTGATLLDAGSGATAGLASNYTVGNISGLSANIAQKALTVTGVTAANKVYDGGVNASLAGGTLSGLVGSETVGLSALSGAFIDKNAGTGKEVKVSGAALTDGTGLAANYTVASPSGLVADISRAPITGVSNIVADTRVYNGTTTATLSGAGATFNGMIAGDNLSFNATKADFSDKNVGAAKTVTVGGIALGGLDAGNYVLGNTNGTGSGSITAATINSVSNIMAGNKTYDGNKTASVNASGAIFDGIVTGDSLTVAGASGEFADKDAANNKVVNVSGIALGGVDAGNYVLGNTAATASANIMAKALTLSGQLAGNKVYDGNTTAVLSGGALNGLVGSETLGIAGQTATFSDKNAAGGKAVTVTGTTLRDTANGLASNYSVTNPTGLTASITQKALTVTGQLAGNKVYDGNANASLSGGSLTGLVGSETLTIAGQTATFSDKNAAGGKAVTVTGTTLRDTANGLASNYSVTNPTGLTASITQKALTVTGQLAGNKVYDGNAVASLSGGTLNGLVGSETLTIAGQTASFSDKNAASGKSVTVTGTTLRDTANGLASNYSVSNPTGLTASITQKALTVAGMLADDKVYDGNTSAQLVGGSLIGLVGDETLGLGGVSGNFSDKNAGAGKTVTVSGTTLVDTSNGLAGNYSVADPTGVTASITQKVLTIAGQLAGNKVYDGNAQATLSGGSLTGLVGDEALAIGGQTAMFGDKNAASGKTVTVLGTTLLDTANGLASNYTVTNPTGLTASISRAVIQGVTGIAAGNKVYDGTTQVSLNTNNAGFAGIVAGDKLGVATASGAFANKNAGSAKAVNVSGISLNGVDAGNYTLANTTAATTASIAQAALAVTATGVNKVYDATTGATVVLADNRIAGDVLSVSSGAASFANKNAGAGKAVTVGGIAVGGADAGNYVANTTTATTATITQAALGIKVNDAAKNQGQVNPAFSAAYSGLLGSDTVASEVTGTLAFSTLATTASPAAAYQVAASGQTSGNYAITYAPGVLTVNAVVTPPVVTPPVVTPPVVTPPVVTPPAATPALVDAAQDAVANVIAMAAVAPSQGNLVHADLVIDKGVPEVAAGPASVSEQGSDKDGGKAPAVQVNANVVTNMLPGLKLTVLDRGLLLPSEANATIENQK